MARCTSITSKPAFYRAAEQITTTQSKPCGSICGQSAAKDLDDPMESQRSVPNIPGYGKTVRFSTRVVVSTKDHEIGTYAPAARRISRIR